MDQRTLKAQLLKDGQELSLLSLAEIERLTDLVKQLNADHAEAVAQMNSRIDFISDTSVRAVATNRDCILALEDAGMREAAGVLRRMK